MVAKAWGSVVDNTIEQGECLSQPLLPLVRWLLVLDVRLSALRQAVHIRRQLVKDVQIRSVGNDPRRGRLEIEFTWTDDVRQFIRLHGCIPAVARSKADVFILE